MGTCFSGEHGAGLTVNSVTLGDILPKRFYDSIKQGYKFSVPKFKEECVTLSLGARGVKENSVCVVESYRLILTVNILAVQIMQDK